MLVIGHRGAAARAPENTLAGISAGLEAGAAAVEVDLRLTADGRIVLLHDSSVDRTTDGSGEVCRLTREELRAFDAGFAFPAPDGSRPFRGCGVTVPTLEEAWDLAGGRLVMEIKGAWGTDEALGTARILCEFLQGRDAAASVASSFDVRAVRIVREAVAGCPTGVLTAAAFDAASNIAAAVEGGHDVCYLPDAVVDASAIAAAHAAGKHVVAWTVNDPSRVRGLADAGADGVVTDDPAMAVAVLDDQ